MLTKDCNFRDIYHKVCFIECADQIQNLKKVFNVSKKDNGVLAYGYIDHEDGFTFEVGYTDLVSAWDWDYLTKETLCDFKVS